MTEAVEEFGWRDQLVGTLRQELDVFPLHTLRGMAQSEMGAIRRRSTSLVLTKTGRLMTADPAARWHIGTAALIGPDDGPQPDFSVAVREAALMVILTSGPTGYDELTKLLTDMHGVEGWAAGGGAGAGRAGTGRAAPGCTAPGCTAPGWPAPSAPSSTRCGTGCGRSTCSAPSAASARRYR